MTKWSKSFTDTIINTDMTDIEKAKKIFFDGGYSCILCRGNSAFTSSERGIKRLLDFCSDGNSYNGFSVADKIVGKAAAFLYAKMGVENVYAQVLSRKGEQVLIKYGIRYSYGTLCDEIINRKGDDICPMEKTVINIENYDEAYEALLNKISEIA